MGYHHFREGRIEDELGPKARGNFKIGYDNGRDAASYQSGVRERIVYGKGEKNKGTRIINMISRLDDGSKMDKPISQAYYDLSKRQRPMDTEHSSQEFRPGDYGTGKRIPRNFR